MRNLNHKLGEPDMVRDLPALRSEVAAVERIAMSAGVLLPEKPTFEPRNNFDEWTALSTYGNLCEQHIIAASSGRPLPTAPSTAVPANARPAPRPAAPVNFTELCRQEVQANGSAPIYEAPNQDAASRGELVRQSFNQDSQPEARAGGVAGNAAPAASSAPSAQRTATEACRAHNDSLKKAKRIAKISPMEASKMTTTELCRAARENLPAPSGTNEKYEAYRQAAENP
jgi:hypothetical protein